MADSKLEALRAQPRQREQREVKREGDVQENGRTINTKPETVYTDMGADSRGSELSAK